MAADLKPTRRRGLALAVLAAGVLLVHWGAGEWAARRMAAFASASSMPQRIQVSYVRQMELAPPPARVAMPVRAKRRAAVPQPVAAPASAPLPPPEPPTEVAAAVHEPEPPPPEAAASDATLATAAAASSPVTPGEPFEWPESTRLRYELIGDYRGEVRGDAQVEWILQGERYQVHLDVSVALLASRRMSSDGRITPEGLAPQRYDQETMIVLRDPVRSTVRFEGGQVLLANGRHVPHVAGVQDTVSQFVQMSWLFATQPERLRAGERIELPLAMPRNVSIWAYEVQGEEFLHTPFGAVQAFHLKPLREPRAGGDMTVDIWIAPQLRYLPVRFRIRPDPEAYFDLMLDRRPELAARPRI